MKLIATTLLSALLAAGSLSACKEDKGDGTVGAGAGKPGSSASHDCTIIVAAKPGATDPISGSGTAADEGAATEAAWTDACKKLPPPEQPACRDANRWQPTTSIGRAKEVTVTITLAPAPPPQVQGKGTSSESEEAACQAALLDACGKAGGAGDCVAAGTHEQKGKMASSSTK